MREEDAGSDIYDPVPQSQPKQGAKMSQETAVAVQAEPVPLPKQAQRSLMREMSERFGMEPAPFQQALMATVMPKNSSMEAVAAFLVVAREHGLNPFAREIFAFESQGGVRPMVSIDGWTRIVNRHPQYDGCELVEIFDGDKFAAVECRMYRKDRQHPIVLREYLDECHRDTQPWNKWPKRMLRHKAFMQTARLAFSFSGIEDEDEVERAEMVVRPRRNAVEVGRIDIGAARAGVPQDPAGGVAITSNPEPKKEPTDGAKK